MFPSACGKRLTDIALPGLLDKAYLFRHHRERGLARGATDDLDDRNHLVLTVAVIEIVIGLVMVWLCQVNSPRGTMPGCTFDDPATFGIAFRLKSSATPSGCITDTA